MKSTSSEAYALIRQSRTYRLPTSCLVAVVAFLCLFGNVSNLGATIINKNFPTFPAIQSNVAFWEKIYTTYSTSEAVIHDKYDLTKIYGVIPIIDYLQPGARKLNEPVLETAKQKYSAILIHIAQGGPPTTKEEHRIAAMYQGARKSQLLKASESIRVQIGQKERFREGVVRSRAYLHEIKQILRSYDLPEELAYLPHVESSFNPDAYSKAGASGLWQFTRSTGKQYLHIDHTIDERQNPFKATHAAAKFLKRNHSVLGNWPLALTAYNCGTSGMARAKRDKGSYEKIFLEYEEGHFKFASRNYYPEFLAALQAAQKFEQNLSPRPPQPTPMATIRLTSRSSIESISRHFKVDINTIKMLNPAINSAIFQEKAQLPQGFELKLPATVLNLKKQTVTQPPNANFRKNRTSTVAQK
jgi:membrane-bound lytic murein transglycosylase D